ncbi:hypothetical protein C8R43DRAFT_961772 [Mycena crocata]|nr:hypothetical protein C8R43DRAFT_961772 [Mycena crocata]
MNKTGWVIDFVRLKIGIPCAMLIDPVWKRDLPGLRLVGMGLRSVGLRLDFGGFWKGNQGVGRVRKARSKRVALGSRKWRMRESGSMWVDTGFIARGAGTSMWFNFHKPALRLYHTGRKNFFLAYDTEWDRYIWHRDKILNERASHHYPQYNTISENAELQLEDSARLDLADGIERSQILGPLKSRGWKAFISSGVIRTATLSKLVWSEFSPSI